MLIQAKIYTASLNGKYYSGLLIDKIYEQELNGEDCTTLKQKSIILTKWINILEDYLDNNFDGDGNLIPSIFPCLSIDEINSLVSKINILVGNNTPPMGSDWILATAFWNDGGYWRDNGIWNDTLPII